jgi:hypothetical protein
VIGALVIFSGGVILAVSLSRALTTQMSHATVRSEVSALGRQTMDSLSVLRYDEAVPGGPQVDSPQLSGRTFTRTITVAQDGVRTRRIQVEIVSPLAGGPTFNGTTWVVERW